MIKVHLLKRSVLRKATKKQIFSTWISIGGGPGLKFVSFKYCKAKRIAYCASAKTLKLSTNLLLMHGSQSCPPRTNECCFVTIP